MLENSFHLDSDIVDSIREHLMEINRLDRLIIKEVVTV